MTSQVVECLKGDVMFLMVRRSLYTGEIVSPRRC